MTRYSVCDSFSSLYELYYRDVKTYNEMNMKNNAHILHQGCIKLIKCDSKDFYIVLKKNNVFFFFIYIMFYGFHKNNKLTVFNITNHKKSLLSSKSAY